MGSNAWMDQNLNHDCRSEENSKIIHQSFGPSVDRKVPPAIVAAILKLPNLQKRQLVRRNDSLDTARSKRRKSQPGSLPGEEKDCCSQADQYGAEFQECNRDYLGGPKSGEGPKITPSLYSFKSAEFRCSLAKLNNKAKTISQNGNYVPNMPIYAAAVSDRGEPTGGLLL